MHADPWSVSLTADKLEESMVIAPKPEASLFMNRDKFDIVAVCDQDSESFAAGKGPLSVLVQVISEQAFKKMLQRMPMLVVGGFEAWKKEFGEDGLIRDGIDDFVPPTSPSQTLTGISNATQQETMVKIAPGGLLHSPKPMPSPHNPFVVNGGGAGASTSPSVAALVPDVLASPSMNPFRTSPSASGVGGDASGVGGDASGVGGEHQPNVSSNQKLSYSRCVVDA